MGGSGEMVLPQARRTRVVVGQRYWRRARGGGGWQTVYNGDNVCNGNNRHRRLGRGRYSLGGFEWLVPELVYRGFAEKREAKVG